MPWPMTLTASRVTTLLRARCCIGANRSVKRDSSGWSGGSTDEVGDATTPSALSVKQCRLGKPTTSLHSARADSIRKAGPGCRNRQWMASEHIPWMPVNARSGGWIMEYPTMWTLQTLQTMQPPTGIIHAIPAQVEPRQIRRISPCLLEMLPPRSRAAAATSRKSRWQHSAARRRRLDEVWLQRVGCHCKASDLPPHVLAARLSGYTPEYSETVKSVQHLRRSLLKSGWYKRLPARDRAPSGK